MSKNTRSKRRRRSPQTHSENHTISNWLIAKNLVAAGHTIEYVEGGSSMTPLIFSRQPVTLSPVDPSKLEKGDIVLVKVRGNVYTHKVTGLKPGEVHISNNHGHDNGWTAHRNVFAIVTAISGVPVGGAERKVLRPTTSSVS